MEWKRKISKILQIKKFSSIERYVICEASLYLDIIDIVNYFVCHAKNKESRKELIKLQTEYIIKDILE